MFTVVASITAKMASPSRSVASNGLMAKTKAPTSAWSQSPCWMAFTAVCSAVSEAEQAVEQETDGPIRFRW